MSPGVFGVYGQAIGFPRVSGDEPYRYDEDILGWVFSPRERG